MHETWMCRARGVIGDRKYGAQEAVSSVTMRNAFDLDALKMHHELSVLVAYYRAAGKPPDRVYWERACDCPENSTCPTRPAGGAPGLPSADRRG